MAFTHGLAVLLLISTCHGASTMTNSWAIQVSGGIGAADELASKHGFVNLGQVRPCQVTLWEIVPS